MMALTQIEPSRSDLDGTHIQLAGLRKKLLHLVGETFRFTRITYGDELTLHFGDLLPAVSPKLNGRLYGSHIFGARGSHWIIKSGKTSTLLVDGFPTDKDVASRERRLTSEQKQRIETNPHIEPGSRLLEAIPFTFWSNRSIAVQLGFSDSSSLFVFPTAEEGVEENDETEALPEIADWELILPDGLLNVGPGPVWSFEPKKTPSEAASPS
jgi:hypothetical protein